MTIIQGGRVICPVSTERIADEGWHTANRHEIGAGESREKSKGNQDREHGRDLKRGGETERCEGLGGGPRKRDLYM